MISTSLLLRYSHITIIVYAYQVESSCRQFRCLTINPTNIPGLKTATHGIKRCLFQSESPPIHRRRNASDVRTQSDLKRASEITCLPGLVEGTHHFQLCLLVHLCQPLGHNMSLKYLSFFILQSPNILFFEKKIFCG